MAIDEKTRLDLRQAFADLIGPDLADAAMEAMPNLDYDQLATKTDVDNVRIELRGEMAELRGDMAELRAELKGDMAELRVELKGEMTELAGETAQGFASLKAEMATNLRISVLTHLATTATIVGTFIGLS